MSLDGWYRTTWLQVYRFAYARVQNREEAEDLTQETYAKLMGRPDAAPPSPQFLFTTVLNLIRDRWRRKQTRGVAVPFEEALLGSANQVDEALSRAWVRGLMDRLPPEYNLVLDLHIVQGYSRAETARRIGKSEDAVRGLLYRGLKTLRELMRQQLEEERAHEA